MYRCVGLGHIFPMVLTGGVALWMGVSVAAQDIANDEVVGFVSQDISQRVNLAEGFRFIKLAGNDQVPNAYAMTIHPSGDAIVSGPGYIRRLKLTSRGVSSVINLPHAPPGGAQGLCVHGDDLLFVGGPGLCRISGAFASGDTKQNMGRLQREVLLKIDVGYEHQAHAIRNGADGWWYLICGNKTSLLEKFSSDEGSPVKDPRAGCLLRLSPDFERCQVFADGFRNPYDFDFGDDGSIYVYDSDGERDVALPWYRPTRVFRIAAGDNAGWVNRSWKRPSEYFDMPEEMAALGRASPTGVCFNRSQVLGDRFYKHLFVADWTFGKITAVPVGKKDGKPTIVLEAMPPLGCAVTDLEFGPDGLLYVTVGGRGTEGGLFRIEPVNLDRSVASLESKSATDSDSHLRQLQGAEIGRRKKIVPEDSLGGDEQRFETIIGYLELLRQSLVRDSTVAHRQPDGNCGQTIRKCQLILGGCGGVEGMFAGYTAMQPVSLSNQQFVKFEQAVVGIGREFFRRPDSRDRSFCENELLRLAAMINCPSDALASFAFELLQVENDPVRGIHLLNCYAMICQTMSPVQATAISEFLLTLKDQIAADGQNIDGNWEPRMQELVARLSTQAAFRSAVLADKRFGETPTLFVAGGIVQQARKDGLWDVNQRVANQILAWCERHLQDTTDRHVRLLCNDQSDDRQKAAADGFLRRALVRVPRLADVSVKHLSKRPQVADRGLFIVGLENPSWDVCKHAVIGLRRLLASGVKKLTLKESQAVLQTVSRLEHGGGPSESVRKQIALLLEASLESKLDIAAIQTTPLKRVLEQHFGQPIELEQNRQLNLEQLINQIKSFQGDEQRGSAVFVKTQCARCHQSQNANLIGPSLSGVAKRFSTRDLLRAIVDPDHHVADRYRSVIVLTNDGELMVGLKVYQATDGITMLLSDGTTARINARQIQEVKTSTKSLMPSGLLDNLSAQENADLMAYLKTL